MFFWFYCSDSLEAFKVLSVWKAVWWRLSVSWMSLIFLLKECYGSPHLLKLEPSRRPTFFEELIKTDVHPITNMSQTLELLLELQVILLCIHVHNQVSANMLFNPNAFEKKAIDILRNVQHNSKIIYSCQACVSPVCNEDYMYIPIPIDQYTESKCHLMMIYWDVSFQSSRTNFLWKLP